MICKKTQILSRFWFIIFIVYILGRSVFCYINVKILLQEEAKKVINNLQQQISQYQKLINETKKNINIVGTKNTDLISRMLRLTNIIITTNASQSINISWVSPLFDVITSTGIIPKNNKLLKNKINSEEILFNANDIEPGFGLEYIILCQRYFDMHGKYNSALILQVNLSSFYQTIMTDIDNKMFSFIVVDKFYNTVIYEQANKKDLFNKFNMNLMLDNIRKAREGNLIVNGYMYRLMESENLLHNNVLVGVNYNLYIMQQILIIVKEMITIFVITSLVLLIVVIIKNRYDNIRFGKLKDKISQLKSKNKEQRSIISTLNNKLQSSIDTLQELDSFAGEFVRYVINKYCRIHEKDSLYIDVVCQDDSMLAEKDVSLEQIIRKAIKINSKTIFDKKITVKINIKQEILLNDNAILIKRLIMLVMNNVIDFSVMHTTIEINVTTYSICDYACSAKIEVKDLKALAILSEEFPIWNNNSQIKFTNTLCSTWEVIENVAENLGIEITKKNTQGEKNITLFIPLKLPANLITKNISNIIKFKQND